MANIPALRGTVSDDIEDGSVTDVLPRRLIYSSDRSIAPCQHYGRRPPAQCCLLTKWRSEGLVWGRHWKCVTDLGKDWTCTLPLGLSRYVTAKRDDWQTWVRWLRSQEMPRLDSMFITFSSTVVIIAMYWDPDEAWEKMWDSFLTAIMCCATSTLIQSWTCINAACRSV